MAQSAVKQSKSSGLLNKVSTYFQTSKDKRDSAKKGSYKRPVGNLNNFTSDSPRLADNEHGEPHGGANKDRKKENKNNDENNNKKNSVFGLFSKPHFSNHGPYDTVQPKSKNNNNNNNNKKNNSYNGGNNLNFDKLGIPTRSNEASMTNNSIDSRTPTANRDIRLIAFGFDCVLTKEKATNKRDLGDNKRVISYIFGGMNRILMLKQFLSFLKHNKIKLIIISNNKEKYIKKCLENAGLLTFFNEKDLIYDQSSVIDHNGYESNVMEYLVKVKYQIDASIINLSINDFVDGDEKEKEKEKEQEEFPDVLKDKCNALFVDSNKSIMDKLRENTVCNVYHINNNGDSGLQLHDMTSIAQKMGLDFDTREKWYM